MEENILIKVLEYGKVSDLNAFKAISSSLSLEFYCESNPVLYTLSSENFVLDISEDSSCVLTFVDDCLNSRFAYIQEYLSFYSRKKKLFYFLLKFLISCTSESADNKAKNDTSDSEISKTGKYLYFCDCIATEAYCNSFNLSSISKSNYNIFTHREYDTDCPIRACALVPYVYTHGSSENLANFFTSEEFSTKHMLSFQDPYYECKNIKVLRNGVFINDERSKIASFAFNRGLTLKDSVDLASKL